MLSRPREPDALRPTAQAALAAWAARVRADREQVERCREMPDPADYYGPVAGRFRMDPRRTDDATLDALLSLAQPSATWLDVGAGGGRYALPLALRVREVIALDPSPAMLAVLREGVEEHGVGNVRVVRSSWPPEGWPAPGAVEPWRADVVLAAHVGYDIEAVGPFLDALEAAARGCCVAVVAEGAMTTAANLFWEQVHGEPRVPLPALPELLALLVARGHLPEVRLVPRVPPTFESLEDLAAMARRQLWVREGSERDTVLQGLVRSVATRRDRAWALDWAGSRIGVVTWEPATAAGAALR